MITATAAAHPLRRRRVRRRASVIRTSGSALGRGSEAGRSVSLVPLIVLVNLAPRSTALCVSQGPGNGAEITHVLCGCELRSSVVAGRVGRDQPGILQADEDSSAVGGNRPRR